MHGQQNIKLDSQ